MAMKPSWLTWQITWRSALRIMLLGALFGAIYGTSVVSVLLAGDMVQQGSPFFLVTSLRQFLGVMLFAAIVGGIIGAAVGIVAGTLVGLLISAITIRAFLPLHDVPRYLRVVQRSSILAGGIGTLIGTPIVAGVLFGAVGIIEEPVMLALFSIIPALLAGVAIWRGSRQIAAWYVRTAGAMAAIERDMPIV
jgi:hypothetical protein